MQAAIGLLLVICSLLVILCLATSNHILQFHYPRSVQNDPLQSPVIVRSVIGNTLHLDDGRAIEVKTNAPLDQLIARSDSRVDLEFDGSEIRVFVNAHGWLCGTPWTALIEIPLIRDDVPINRRELIGFGQLVDANSDAELSPP